MIKIENLSKVYHGQGAEVEALKDINLSVARGEIFGIIGTSGAGKSTLVRCINMLERPTTGRVIVDGMDMAALPAKELRHARQEIGMIFQHFNLLSARTVAGNVAFPLEIAGWSRREIKERVAEMLSLVGLSEKANAYPAELSGGQKQRVGIARALASKPKVLLCDEATSALDPQTTTSILQLLKEINTKLGLTMIIITHEMNVIRQVCDRVAVLAAGRIMEMGPVVDVFTRPQQQMTQEFVRTVTGNAIPAEIWESIKATGRHGRVVRISFIGATTGQPVISGLIKAFQVDVNILYASIDHIQDTPFGTMLVEIVGTDAQQEQALDFLRRQDLEMEVFDLD